MIFFSNQFSEPYKTREMLIADLKRCDATIETKGSVKKLQELCEKQGIAIRYQKPKVRYGWANKPKGSLQILFELGFIDPTNWKSYTEKGTKDEYGILREETSLKNLIKIQHDFMSELTLLQFHGQKLGVVVDRTPKCHPEIAGEGIEYIWSYSKCIYCGMH